MKIVVILPTFNRQELLKRALISLQDQTYANWVAYIVDDCSKNDTYTFLSANDILEDKRINYTRLEVNSGVNFARNIALKQITNNDDIDYVVLLDDDDWFLPTYFESIVPYMKSNKGWIVTKCIDNSGKDITILSQVGEVDYLDYLSGSVMRGDATMCIKKSLLQNISFSTHYKNGYEWIFFLKLSTKSKMYVVDIPSKVVEYLNDGLSKSKKIRNNDKKLYQHQVFNKYGYNYYAFLAKKHSVIYRENKKVSSFVKKIAYEFISKIVK